MPKKIIRKFKNKPRKKRYFKKNNNKFRSKINYPNSTKVQTFGPGNFKINIEQQFVVDADAAGLYRANVAGYINDSVEFQEYSSRFMFYRVEQIGITIFPNDEIKNLETGLGIDWYNMISDAQGFLTWDSRKVIFNNNVKTKTFFFKLPNAMLEGLNSGPWNFKNYNAVNINLPGKVCLYVPGVTRVQGRIVARIAFKVPRPGFFNKTNNPKQFNYVNEVRLLNVPKSKFGEAIFQDPGFKTRFKIENYLENKAAKKENKKYVNNILKKSIESINNIKNKYNLETEPKKEGSKNKNLKNKKCKSASKVVNKAELQIENSANISIEKQPNLDISMVSSVTMSDISDISFNSRKSRFQRPPNPNFKDEYIKECWLQGGFDKLPKIKNCIALDNETLAKFTSQLCNSAMHINKGHKDKTPFYKALAHDLKSANKKNILNKRVLNIIGTCFLRFLGDINSGKNEVMERWYYIFKEGTDQSYKFEQVCKNNSLLYEEDDDVFDFNKF